MTKGYAELYNHETIMLLCAKCNDMACKKANSMCDKAKEILKFIELLNENHFFIVKPSGVLELKEGNDFTMVTDATVIFLDKTKNMQ